MRKQSKKLIQWLMLLLGLFGHTARLYSNNTIFRNYSTKEGLDYNFVKSIYKDNNNILWIGTTMGLNQFDGHQIISYKPEKEEATDVIAITDYKTPRKLLIGTSKGLFEFDKQSKDILKLPHLRDTLITAMLYEKPSNELFTGTSEGLYIIDAKGQKTAFHFLNNGSESKAITSIKENDHDHLWISTSNSLFRFNKKGRLFELIKQFDANQITSLHQIDSLLYIGTKKGLFTLNFEKGKITPVKKFYNRIILSLESAPNNTLYIGTDGYGIFNYDHASDSILQSFEHSPENAESISSNAIYALYRDNDNILWAGNYSTGFSCLLPNSKKFTIKSVLVDGNRLSRMSVRSFLIEKEKYRFYGTRNGLIIEDNKGKSTHLSTADNAGLRSNIITSIIKNRHKKEEYFIATYGGGISVFDAQTHSMRPILTDTTSLYGNFFQLKIQGNSLWTASVEGLIEYSLFPTISKKRLINPYEYCKSTAVNSLLIDTQNRFWIGTQGGVAIYYPDTEKITKLLDSKALSSQIINIYEDSKHNIWVSTYKNGLFCFDKNLELIHRYTTEDGLPDMSVASIQEATDGYWLSTFLGFCHLNPESGRLINYSLADGVPGLMFCAASSTQDQSGRLWWGSESGIMYFHPDSLTTNNLIHNTIITQVKINGVYNRFNPDSSTYITIAGKKNELSLRFTSANYINSEDNKYKYRLLGSDNENWISTTDKPEAIYSNLPQGKYTFEVWGSNNDEKWSKLPTKLNISVKYNFYETNLFWILIYILILLLCAVITYYIVQQNKSTNTSEEDLNEKKEPKLKFDQNKGNEILQHIESYMLNTKPYLKPDFKLTDMAESTGYPIHDVSYALNQFKECNFSDYINEYRIEEIKTRFKNQDTGNMKLTGVAFECGFNSKSSFYRAFKKSTGKTPAEFLKEYSLTEISD